VTARIFANPDPLAEYGLDRPRAVLVFVLNSGGSVTLWIGSADFDRRGVYVGKPEDPRVYLAPADALRPVLALVGITLAPPEE